LRFQGFIPSRPFAVLGLMLPLLSSAPSFAAHLTPATSQAWDEYVESANARMAQRLSAGTPFLWIDEEPDRLARVRAGELVVSPIGPQTPKKVPSGLIHDWIGAVFVPNTSLNDVLQVVRDYARYKDLYQPGVIDCKVIATGEDKDRFSMLLMNKALLLKTAFDADYESRYVQVDEHRAYSISRTTRVQEIADYGSTEQHALNAGEGNGIIWHLMGITRFLQRDGGVYIELEALGLSRDIPAAIRWFVEPTVRRVSRDALSTSLEQTEKAVRIHAELAKAELAKSDAGPASGSPSTRRVGQSLLGGEAIKFHVRPQP
jgi:hypothetical protein